MKNPVLHVVEMIMGAALFGMALLYLTWQKDTLNKMVETATVMKLEQNHLYQQYSNENVTIVSDEQIYAQIMGYREYPIIIDGNEIAVDSYDYDFYFTFLKDGYYKKSYDFNAYHEIQKIIFNYTGI